MTTGNTSPRARLEISPARCKDLHRTAEFLAHLVKEIPSSNPSADKRNAIDSAKETIANLRDGDCRGRLGETGDGLTFMCDRTVDCGANRSVDLDVFLSHPESR